MTEPRESVTTDPKKASPPGDTNRRTTPDTQQVVGTTGSTGDSAREFLTDDEHTAVRLAGELWNHLCRTIPDGPTRDADMHELVLHIHGIQHAIMANAAARAYPDMYRALGRTIREP